MSPYVKESTPVAVKAANTLPELKPGSDGSVTLPNFTGFTYGEVVLYSYGGEAAHENRTTFCQPLREVTVDI